MKTVQILFVVVFACAMLYAANSTAYPPGGENAMLELNKSAQLSAALGDTITVNIAIRNKGSSSVSAVVEEDLGNVEAVSPQPTYSNITEGFYARPPYLSWAVDIAPGETKTLTYTIKPKTVGLLNMGPSKAYVGGGTFYSNSLMIDVACTSSPSCDESVGETPLSCPAKCAAANATGETAPTFTPQPVASAPVGLPDVKANLAEVNAEEKKSGDEKNNQILMIGGVVAAVLIAIAAYFLLIRKSPKKY